MPDPVETTGARFRAVLAQEGVETSDRRIIEPGALTWRELPLPFMWLQETTHGGMQMNGSVLAGRIDTITREGNDLIGTGRLDTGEDGLEFARLVAGRMIRGVSIDVTAAEVDLEVIEEDEDGWPIEWLEHLTAGEIAMATGCPMPAFAGAYIELLDEVDPETGRVTGEAEPAEAVAASADPLPGVELAPAWREVDTAAALVAAGGPTVPPRAWFEDPHLDGPTPLVVAADGRVYGHVAVWGTPHLSLGGMTPPRSRTDYAYFRTGAVLCDDGELVSTGVLTLGTGHAPMELGSDARAVMAHYDDTGTAWADVTVGEDAYGIWIAGAQRPDLTDAQVRAARGSALSGDWRRQGGHLEMVAALSVNVPGFGIERPRSVAASGAPLALVAAGAAPLARLREHGGVDLTAMEQRLAAQIERALQPVVGPALEARRSELRARRSAPLASARAALRARVGR